MLVALHSRPQAADSALVLAAGAGDRAAFGLLYGRYRKMIHGILLAHVSYSDAEDLMQDVFVQAMRQLPGLREPEAFGGWLATIARRLAVDSHRRRKSTVEVTERNCGATKQDDAAMVLEKIRALPEAYRETLMLRLVEGMTGPEIAARCGLAESSVRVNLCRGMKTLRAKLGTGMAMSDEYLWDRTGDPDPEIDRLEGLLAPYRDRGARRNLRSVWPSLAIAAVLLIAAVLALHRPESEWQLAMNGGQSRAMKEGQTVETNATETAALDASSIGEVKLEANSRMTVEHSHMALKRGTLHAFIWAPPAQFVVETPSARTIDLGCAYTLQVADDGSGLLTVNLGWVAFQTGALESFIPAGAACRTHPGSGPGVPYFEDAPETLRQSVAAFDASNGRSGLPGIIASARERDALTLWHLLLRTRNHDRELVAWRFAALVPGVNAAKLQAGDHAALDEAWNALGLGGTDWWRTWKQKW